MVAWEVPWKVLKLFSNSAYKVKELADDNRIMHINGKYLEKYKPLLQEIKITQD
jgi:hypothetical protein